MSLAFVTIVQLQCLEILNLIVKTLGKICTSPLVRTATSLNTFVRILKFCYYFFMRFIFNVLYKFSLHPCSLQLFSQHKIFSLVIQYTRYIHPDINSYENHTLSIEISRL